VAHPATAAALDARPSLTFKRHLNASPEKVFAAWTDPQKLVQWFGRADARRETMRAEIDLRVGGRYRVSFSIPAGEYFEVGGVYREVVPNQRLKFTWAWHSTPERESLVTIEFKPDADGTLMIFRQEQFADQAARDNHERGWNKFFDVLEKSLG
jgi:uncharacterized protein YndB with AHSA1/START domain